jgi:glycosyltransferase involved in cell wall biosynthesis
MSVELRKVVQVLRRVNPDRWGGTETVVFSTAEELIARGIASPVFCAAMMAPPGAVSVRGVAVRRFPYVYPWLFLGPEARRALDLKGGNAWSYALYRALLSEPEVSILHAHVQLRFGGTVRTVARRRGIPYVVSLHGGQFRVPEAENADMIEPFRGKLEWGKLIGLLLGSRRTLSDAAAIICVGANEVSEVQARYPGKRVEYVPNGVRVDHFAKADGDLFRRRCGAAPGDKLVVCVSRLDYQKNQLLLVQAFARFLKQHRDWRLVLVGPVTAEAYHERILATAAASIPKDRFTVIPGFGPEDPLLPAAFRAADIFVLPTRHEPFGIVVLEAWAARAPVIATRVGGIPGFAEDGKDVLFFPPDDEEALVQRLETLAQNPELRRALGEAGHEKARRDYDWAVIARRTESLYREVIAAHGG